MSRLHRVFIIVLLSVIVAIPATGAVAQSGGDDALRKDAREYASAMGVSLQEAIRRLSLQDAIGKLNVELSTNEGDTFAGLWIQHQPEYRVVVGFTRNGEPTIRRRTAGGPLAGIIQVRAAKATLRELETARAEAVGVARRVAIRSNSGINIIENRAELYVLDPIQFDTALRKANVQLPGNARVVKTNGFPKEATNIYGGLALTDCTSGFSVRSASGVNGITTAGHCADSQQYSGVSLPWISGTTGGVTDIQWNLVQYPHSNPNWIWDGTYNRYIFNTKFRASQSVGEWVCKYGRASGYTCGTIQDKNFDGVNVRVNTLVQGGDSGGPWFWNNTAYGTTISFIDANNAIYGPVDHIYNVLGVWIKTS